MSTSQTGSGVAGFCPMGCGETLFFGAGNRITCRVIGCPDPAAVDRLLDDRETEHVVEFRPGDFIIRHPLRERVDDALMTCALHEHVARLDGPPVAPGRYRARQATPRGVTVGASASGWTWERLSEVDG